MGYKLTSQEWIYSPSEDDVSVLRRELVHAQQLMDKITQEKVEEISEHLTSIRNLTLDRQQFVSIFLYFYD